MNINQEMQSLGHIGARSYTPSDELIEQLLGKAKRARAVRQGAVGVVSAASAIALGAVAVQVINASKDDPAFRDRNLINDHSRLTPIEKFHAKYGDQVPTNVLESDVDIDKIIQDLKAAAQANDDLKGLEEQGDQTGTGGSKPSGGTKPAGETCTAKTHPDKPYKVWDCAKGEWVIKAGWFYDDFADAYVQCSAQNSYAFGYYDCSKGKWKANPDYFYFGDGNFYQIIVWTDAATGQSTTGNYSPSYDKAIFAPDGGTSYTDYKHLEGKASWSGSTCNGTTTTIKNAPFRFSCLKDSLISHNNGSYGNVAKQWILQDANYKWFSPEGKYYCIDTPPAGYTWDGSQWVLTTPAP